MLKKHLLKISLLLPLMAISATAYAGSTITDRSYWPNEERTKQNCWFAKRFEFCARVRPGAVTYAARDEYERRWILMALSGRPEIPVMHQEEMTRGHNART